MRFLFTVVAVCALAACGAAGSAGTDGVGMGPAPLRGFGVEVDQALAQQVPEVHLKTCGPWGCHEQDVPLIISGPTSAMPCPSSAAPDAACGVAQLPGPGPGYGYAPVPALTLDQVTVTVTTPRTAPVRIEAEVLVRPSTVCPQDPGRPGGAAEPSSRATCPGGAPQAQLRIAADGSVRQSR